MCKLRYKVITTLTLTGFNFFPEIILLGLLFYPKLTHPSTCIVHAEYHYCVTVYRSDVQPEKQSDHNFDTYGFQFFPGNHLRSSNSNYTDLKNKADHNDVSASLI